MSFAKSRSHAGLRAAMMGLALPLALAAAQSPETKSLSQLKGEAAAAEAAKDWPTAHARFEAALALARKGGQRAEELQCLTGLGRCLQAQHQPDAALARYLEALPLAKALGDRAMEGTLHFHLGDVRQATSHYAEALADDEISLAIARERGDKARESALLNAMGWIHRSLGQYDKAIDYQRQALAVARELKDRRQEGNALNALGSATKALSRFEEARGYFLQALAIFRALKDPRGEAFSLNSLGTIAYYSESQFEKAIEYYSAARVLFREVKDLQKEGAALNNLGLAYDSLNQPERAIEHYQQALQIFRAVKDRFGEGLVLGNLALSHGTLNQLTESIRCQEQALAIHREIKDRDGEGLSLGNLGCNYKELGDYDKAVDYLQQALAILREVKNVEDQAVFLNNLGDVYFLKKDPTRALARHHEALALFRQLKDLVREAESLRNLMGDWKALRQPSVAIFCGKQAVNTYQEVRANLRGLEKGVQKSFLQRNEAAYRDLADLLIAEGRLAEAQQVVGLLKEEEYFEFVRRDSKDTEGLKARADLNAHEAEWAQRYAEIGDRLVQLGAERGTLLAKPGRTEADERRLTQLEADLTVASQAFQGFLDKLEAGSLPKEKVFLVREAQGLMEDLRELGHGVVAIYTLVGEDRLRVILITPDVQKAYEIPIGAADLNRKVFAFRQAVQDPQRDPAPLGKELYGLLLAPMAKDLRAAGAETLMWSLDGALRYLPLAALHDGEDYLVARYRNVVFTPASHARLKDLPTEAWRALGLGVSKSHEEFQALPGVPLELQGIVRGEGRSGGVLPGQVELDEAFTLPAMTAALHKRFPVVHIASHFQFRPGNESDSFLLLGDGRHLTLPEIKTLPNLFGGVELLALSACNTASGGRSGDGKEVEGFAVMSQRLGAKAVVATLWPVADASTTRLMADFYRRRGTKAAMTKGEALRQAQVALLRDAAFHHPYYWAPFILIGNWR